MFQEVREYIKRKVPFPIIRTIQNYHVKRGWAKEEEIYPRYIRGNYKTKGKPCYIFYRPYWGVGILLIYRNGLAQIARLKRKGYTVAIDFENTENALDEKIGCVNIWDSVFEQPCGVSVEEVLSRRKVIMERGFTYLIGTPKIKKNYDNKYYRRKNKKFSDVFCIKEGLREEWDREFSQRFQRKRILGVALRESFRIMRENQTGWSENHPDEPKTDEIIEIVKNKLQEFCCDYVYVTTEYKESIDAMQREFGDKLLFVNRSRKCADLQEIDFIKKIQETDTIASKKLREEKSHKEKIGEVENVIGYVKEIYGLSKCSSLIGTPSSGLTIALFWNGGKYEQVTFFGEKSMKSGAYFER